MLDDDLLVWTGLYMIPFYDLRIFILKNLLHNAQSQAFWVVASSILSVKKKKMFRQVVKISLLRTHKKGAAQRPTRANAALRMSRCRQK